LAADEIFEIFFNVLEGFGEAGLFVDGVDGEVAGGDGGVGEAVSDRGAQQSSIRSETHPEIFFGSVVDDFVDEVWTPERFAAAGPRTRRGVACSPSTVRLAVSSLMPRTRLSSDQQ
jgi:hypothetical protein